MSPGTQDKTRQDKTRQDKKDKTGQDRGKARQARGTHRLKHSVGEGDVCLQDRLRQRLGTDLDQQHRPDTTQHNTTQHNMS
jgi:hypothetical protein